MTESMNDSNSTIESESSVEPSLNTESKNKVKPFTKKNKSAIVVKSRAGSKSAFSAQVRNSVIL